MLTLLLLTRRSRRRHPQRAQRKNEIKRLEVLLKQILKHLNVLVLKVMQVVIKEAELLIYQEFHNIYDNLQLHVYRRMMIMYPQPLV